MYSVYKFYTRLSWTFEARQTPGYLKATDTDDEDNEFKIMWKGCRYSTKAQLLRSFTISVIFYPQKIILISVAGCEKKINPMGWCKGMCVIYEMKLMKTIKNEKENAIFFNSARAYCNF